MTDIFADEQDVAPTKPRIVSLFALMLGVAILGVLVVLGLVLGGVVVGSRVTTSLFGAAVPSVSEIEDAAGVDLPEGADVQAPLDESVYVAGQVALGNAGTEVLTGAGYIELSDIPRRSLELWNGTLESPRYYVTGDGRGALTGLVDGERIIVFYEAS